MGKGDVAARSVLSSRNLLENDYIYLTQAYVTIHYFSTDTELDQASSRTSRGTTFIAINYIEDQNLPRELVKLLLTSWNKSLAA